MDTNMFIGTSGYYYKGWWQEPGYIFGYYPKNISAAKALNYYSRDLSFCELNAPFYRLPSAKAVKNWYRQTPDHFKFLVKFSRYATHNKKLADFEENYHNFWDDRLEHLREKCLGILVQLGPTFRHTKNKSKIDGLTMLQRIEKAGKVNTAVKIYVEFRDPSWFCAEVYSVLKKIGWILVHVNLNNNLNSFGKMKSGFSPDFSEETLEKDFFMARCHGTWDEAYHGGYSQQDLVAMYSKASTYKNAIIAFDNTDSFEGTVAIISGRFLVDGNHVKKLNREYLFPHAISDALAVQGIYHRDLLARLWAPE